MIAILAALGLAPPPPPPVIDAPPPAPRERVLLMWNPGEARCEGVGAVAGVPVRRPYNALIWPPPRALGSVTYNFSIDPAGRPLSIARASAAPVPYGADIAPALAASRFAPGGARGGCTITYTPATVALDEAPLAELASYTMNPQSGRLPRDGWDRMMASGDCTDKPRPRPLLRAFPDFREISGTPGVRDWALVSYDLGPGGVPEDAAIAASTGNGPLERASLTAIGKSRFSADARRGCLYPFRLAPAELPAPPLPAKDALSAGNPACKGDDRWLAPPRRVFPQPYLKRAIEGWAIVRYDVAPWGEIGNISVIEAQPTEDFGTAAMAILRSAKMHPQDTGLTGCVDRVRFRLADGGRKADQDEAPPPPF